MSQEHRLLVGVSLVAVVFGVACGGSEFKVDHGSRDASNGGAPSGSGGTPSTGGVETGGTTSPTDAASSTDAGDSGGAVPPEAGTDAGHDAGSTCKATIWYPDKDGDHYGRTADAIAGCGAPPANGWAAVGNDCDDDEPDVHPNQTTYFDGSYKAPGATQESFDYDCSGTETGDGTQVGPPTCTGTVLNACAGKGYVPTKRTGTGMNNLCGSKQTESCQFITLLCGTALPVSASAYHCK